MFVLVLLGIDTVAIAHVRQVVMKNFVVKKCMLGVIFSKKILQKRLV
jgi:hypothetical protein